MPSLSVTQQTISQNSELNYELVNSENNQLITTNWDIFLSHASSRDALPGEAEFVRQLHERLESDEYGYKVFYDQRDDKKIDRRNRQIALSESNNLVIICSPRYIRRYKDRNNDFGDIPNEVDTFTERVRLTKRKCVLPVLYGVTEIEFNRGITNFPYFYLIDPKLDRKILTDSNQDNPAFEFDHVELAAKKIKEQLDIIWQ